VWMIEFLSGIGILCGSISLKAGILLDAAYHRSIELK
jgi:hypothetical protein